MTGKLKRAPAVPPAELEALARRLADLAAAAGVSPAELARRAGLTDGAVRHYLAGRTAPTLGTLLPLAEALGCRPADLLAGWPAGAALQPPPTRKPKADSAPLVPPDAELGHVPIAPADAPPPGRKPRAAPAAKPAVADSASQKDHGPNRAAVPAPKRRRKPPAGGSDAP